MQQIPIEKVRKDDYVMCYWQAGGGNFAWLVERSGQLFLFVVLGMRSMAVRHWAYEDNRKQVDVVRNVVACMGFQEMPVYAPMNNAREVIKPLLDDIKTFEDTIKQLMESQRKEKNKAVEKIAEKVAGNTNENVTNIESAKKETK